MSNLETKKEVIVGVTSVGQGKRTFWESIRAPLEQSETNPEGVAVKLIEPTTGDFRTRLVWSGIDTIYKAAGKPGWFQDWYGKKRANATEAGLLDQVLVKEANREILEEVKDSASPFLTLHAMYGLGAPRFFAEGDILPEPFAADPQTVVFVPDGKTADALRQFDTPPKEIIPAGFILPEQLQDEERMHERIRKFEAGSPDKNNALEIAYMLTGQLAHMPELYQALEDPMMKQWLKEGAAKLTVYLWNGKAEARRLAKHLRKEGITATITNDYQKECKGVQLCWNSDPTKAVQMSFAIADAADVLVTLLGERVGWPGRIPTIQLAPLKGNRKMEVNSQWAEEKGLVGPVEESHNLRETIEAKFAAQGSAVRRHFDTAHTVFDGGAKLQGANIIAEHMIAAAN